MNIGKLLLQARKDFKKFSSAGGFQLPITITTPNNNLSVSFFNLHSQHHLGWDSDGSIVNVKNSHITIIENELDSYPLRNEKTNEISLRGHKITIINTDSIEKNYVITEAYPSDTFGAIICILGPFKNS